jgi:hypothetical protein
MARTNARYGTECLVDVHERLGRDG